MTRHGPIWSDDTSCAEQLDDEIKELGRQIEQGKNELESLCAGRGRVRRWRDRERVRALQALVDTLTNACAEAELEQFEIYDRRGIPHRVETEITSEFLPRNDPLTLLRLQDIADSVAEEFRLRVQHQPGDTADGYWLKRRRGTSSRWAESLAQEALDRAYAHPVPEGTRLLRSIGLPTEPCLRTLADEYTTWDVGDIVTIPAGASTSAHGKSWLGAAGVLWVIDKVPRAVPIMSTSLRNEFEVFTVDGLVCRVLRAGDRSMVGSRAARASWERAYVLEVVDTFPPVAAN